MQQNYKPFIDRLIQKYEGITYTWDSGDPGGPTKFGVTCYDLAEHRHQHMGSMSAWAPIVRAMSLQEAEDIYVTKYASKDRFNDLKSGADCVMLDYGVNSGTVRPIHVAQAIFHRPVNNVFDDGLLAAINNSNIPSFVNQMCDERMRFLHALRIWPKFGRGWSARVADLRAYCLHLAATPPAPAVVHPAPVAPPVVPPAAVAAVAPPHQEPHQEDWVHQVGDWVTALLHPTGKGIDHTEMLSADSALVHPVTV